MKLSLARSDRLLLGIVLMIAVIAALLHWVFAAPEKKGAILRIPSTYYNTPGGAKAAYEVLERLEYPVSRLRRRIAPETLRGVGVLVLLRPAEGLAPEEVTALENWIDAGHALIVVPGDGTRSVKRGSPSASTEDLQDWFDWNTLTESNTPPGELPSAVRPSSPSRPEAASPLAQGVGELAAPKDRRFAAASPFRGYSGEAESSKIFWQDQNGAIGVEAASGDGTIVALADEYPLTNVGLSEGDNGVLLANLVRRLSAQSPGKIAFDEYHLGFAERDVSAVAIAKLMFVGPWRWAAIQAALLCLLALAGQAIRFGAPRDVVRKVRRQHREFAEAAGRLFEEAGASSLAADTLYGYYRQRLCKALSLDAQTDGPALCDAVARAAGPPAAARLRRAQETVARGQNQAIARQALLSTAQELHRIAETIDHGT